MISLELGREFIDSMAGSNTEPTDIVFDTTALGCNIVCQTQVGFAAWFVCLLAQMVQGREGLAARLITKQFHVVTAFAGGRPKSDDPFSRQ